MNFKERRERKAFLALANGKVFRGYSVGAELDACGEAVFNTGLSGYQEILSDPSYAGQFVVMTAPEIGNYGINSEDMESRKFFAAGFVMREMNEPSNWRSEMSLKEALVRHHIPALAGIDTRALTLELRESGSQKPGRTPGRESITGITRVSFPAKKVTNGIRMAICISWFMILA